MVSINTIGRYCRVLSQFRLFLLRYRELSRFWVEWAEKQPRTSFIQSQVVIPLGMGRLQCADVRILPIYLHIPYLDTWTSYRHIPHILDLYMGWKHTVMVVVWVFGFPSSGFGVFWCFGGRMLWCWVRVWGIVKIREHPPGWVWTGWRSCMCDMHAVMMVVWIFRFSSSGFGILAFWQLCFGVLVSACCGVVCVFGVL